MDRQVYLAVAGGGSGVFGMLAEAGGASRSVLGGQWLYNPHSLHSFLGIRDPNRVPKIVSSEMARALAMRCYQEARRLAGSTADVAGIACTSAAATNDLTKPERLGRAHVAYIAVQTKYTTSVCTFELNAARRRDVEETLVSLGILDQFCRTRGHNRNFLHGGNLTDVDKYSTSGIDIRKAEWDNVADVMHNTKSFVWMVRGKEFPFPSFPLAVFPGRYNPLHEAHRMARAYAEKRLGYPVLYEVSVTNVDKPPMDFIDVDRTIQQFSDESVIISSTPRFSEKSRAYHGGTVFVCGIDTFERVINRDYYKDIDEFLATFERFKLNRNRFLILARHDENGKVKTIADLDQLDSDLWNLIVNQVPPSEFCMEMSSTKLRKAVTT